jgi:rhodanese-related sulfurtransferase
LPVKKPEFKMKKIFEKLNINQKLALIIGVLGFLALFFGNPYKTGSVNLDPKELALIVEGKTDHVSAEELADWIIKGKSDYRLIDLRTEKEFMEYNIPTSENIPLAKLPNSGLNRNEKIVLYSEGGIHSAQAWFLLKAKGFKGVYMLFGGLDEWNDKILFPKLAENAKPEETAAFEKIKEVSKFFGGTPMTGTKADSSAPKMAMPKLDMPSSTTPGIPAGGKKKKEGC